MNRGNNDSMITKSFVELSEDEKNDLLKVLRNKEMYSDDRLLDHPTALFRFLAATSGSRCLLTLIPDLQKWEEHGEKITVVYGFNKLVKLLLDCNPNSCEILGLPRDKYMIIGEHFFKNGSNEY